MSNVMPRWKRMLIAGAVPIGALLLWQLATVEPVHTPTHVDALEAKIKPNMTIADVDKLLGLPDVEQVTWPDGSSSNIRHYSSGITVEFSCPPNGVKDQLTKVTDDQPVYDTHQSPPDELHLPPD